MEQMRKGSDLPRGLRQERPAWGQLPFHTSHDPGHIPEEEEEHVVRCQPPGTLPGPQHREDWGSITECLGFRRTHGRGEPGAKVGPHGTYSREESVAALSPPHRPSPVKVQRLTLYLCRQPCVPPPPMPLAPMALVVLPGDAWTPQFPHTVLHPSVPVWVTMTPESGA